MNARIFAFVRWLVTLLVLRPYAAANTTNRPLAYSIDASKFLLGDERLAYLLNLLWSERVASRGSDLQPCRKSMAVVGCARQPFQVAGAVVALYAVAMINLVALGLRAVERLCYQYVNVSTSRLPFGVKSDALVAVTMGQGAKDFGVWAPGARKGADSTQRRNLVPMFPSEYESPLFNGSLILHLKLILSGVIRRAVSAAPPSFYFTRLVVSYERC